MNDRPRLTTEEFAIALAELHLKGLVEYDAEGDICLTDAGIDVCWQLESKLTPAEKVGLTLYYMCLNGIITKEVDQ